MSGSTPRGASSRHVSERLLAGEGEVEADLDVRRDGLKQQAVAVPAGHAGHAADGIDLACTASSTMVSLTARE